MKSFISKHKVIVTLLSLCILISGIGITYAYYKDTTEIKTNTFTVGNVTTEIEEEVSISGSNITKKPIVTNTGKNNAYIRMRVTVSPSDAATITGWNEKWVEHETDGFYYYQEVVSPGEKTEAIFTGAELKKGFTGDFEITCYQEAVQAEARVEGEITTDMTTIWDAYDNRQAVFKEQKEK